MLANAGNDVHFLFNHDYDFVCKNVLKIDSVSGNFHLQYFNAYNRTDRMPKCDVVLVCLKTTNNKVLKKDTSTAPSRQYLCYHGSKTD